jgi:hypothetical protein
MRPFVSGAGREQHPGGAGRPARPAGQVHVPAEQREADAPPPPFPPAPATALHQPFGGTAAFSSMQMGCIRTRSDNYVASRLKGLCHEMNNLFEGLKNQISTFCICADSF